ncbi:MAG: hypothetical protein EVA67_07135 [OM182 bacterium]|jgi:hypothetical protein|nr:MAG: hypothetical protein EVA67_07135 [OM182 bacterium]|tara:strand:+ start:25957 stop:26457 length:501 start_codon:yes stop_codon:yes gene_type:complete
MSVELLDNPRFYGFRVRRQIDGKTYQEYFSLKENSKRLRGAKRAEIKAVADARDEELKVLQQKNRDKKDREIELDPSGQIRGILCRLKKEKSGTMTPVFQVGVMSRLRGKIVNTTVSITRHGRVEAWQRAVDFYCEHKKIGKRTKTYKELISRCPKPAQIKKYTQQ